MTEDAPAPEPVEEPYHRLNAQYDRMLEAWSKSRRAVADAATTRRRTRSAVQALEREAVELDPADDAGRRRYALALAEKRVRLAELEAREEELTRASQWLQARSDRLRTRKEMLIAAYIVADVRLDAVRAGLGDDGECDLPEAEAGMRRVLEDIAALIVEANREIESVG